MKLKPMIKRISGWTMQEALLYELRQLYYSEIIGLSKYWQLEQMNCGGPDHYLLNNYLNTHAVKIHLLENIFKYMMVEPHRVGEGIETELTQEALPLLCFNENRQLHRISMAGYLQVINAYRVAGYRTAYAFACELRLDLVAENLQQLLELELSAEKDLADIVLSTLHDPENDLENYQELEQKEMNPTCEPVY